MLRKGFGEVIKEHHIRSFTEGELELMISGVGTINIRDWKDNTEYKNCKAADKVSMIIQYIFFLPYLRLFSGFGELFYPLEMPEDQSCYFL